MIRCSYPRCQNQAVRRVIHQLPGPKDLEVDQPLCGGHATEATRIFDQSANGGQHQ